MTDPTSAGYLTLWPHGQGRPTASNLNWSAGETIPNSVTTQVGAGGGIDVSGYYD